MMEMKALAGQASELRTGDIIVWGSSHIGFVYGNLIIHSSGIPKPMAGQDCDVNFQKGPRISELTSGFLSAFNKGKFTILRVISKCVEGIPLVITVDYNKRNAPPYINYVKFTAAGGFPPYRGSVWSSADGIIINEQNDLGWTCNSEVFAAGSGGKMSTYIVKVRDSKGGTFETTFIYY
ncbi:hypothetical protein [Dyadobacter psychrotolerans]|uniref:Uncharacterized protein n=1 Tax=Dyadobacter psychrotolerans TaxID=2541721 RepID=A0A4R5DJ46_9BACT|nr:hypothetical protein [Dyadobacter psychrotolerans]TDE10815.1 hypothetical protein E0F88_27465 [Dyadobacter psychrotolerans]